MTDPVLHHVVSAAYKSDRLFPEPGYELPGKNGEVLATAELAWPTEKIAILLPTEAFAANLFVSQKWTLFQQEDLGEHMDALLEKLPARVKDST